MSERIEIKHTLEVTSTKYIFMLTGNPGKWKFFSQKLDLVKHKLFYFVCIGGHLGFPINTKNEDIVRDHPIIIHVQVGFN
jgi:hypothetical protein